MAIVINSNISSLTAQRALGDSQKMQAQAMERLSTGIRINSAADDAAGLAISENFTSQINGLNQAVRNANEALSLSQTAEGGLRETTDILQRMRELAVQASNTTLTSADRTAIQDEVTALTAEIDRISNTTQYNNQNILDGSASALSFQIGDRAGQTIGLSIDSASASALGLGTSGVATTGGLVQGGTIIDALDFNNDGDSADDGEATYDLDDFYINGKDFGANKTTFTVTNADGSTESVTADASTAYGQALIINSNTSQHGVVATAETRVSGASGSGVTSGITITTGATAVTLDATSSMVDLVAEINDKTSVTATLNARGGMDLVQSQGKDIIFSATANTGIASTVNHGSLSLSSVDGKSDIVISAGADLDASTRTYATSGEGETFRTMELFGLSAGTWSYGNNNSITGTGIVQDRLTSGETLTINGTKIGNTLSTLAADTAVNAGHYVDAINEVSSVTGVTASATTTANVKFLSSTSNNIVSANTETLTLNGVSITAYDGTDSVATIVTNINSAMTAAAIDVRATQTDTFEMQLVSATGANIILTDSGTKSIEFVTNADGNRIDNAGAAYAPAGAEVYNIGGQLTLTSSTGPIELGSSAQTDADRATAATFWEKLGFQMTAVETYAGTGSSGGVDLSTAALSSSAITAIDAALSAVNTIRGSLGAVQNRLEHSVSSLSQMAENHSAARSRVMDADFAAESAALSKSQVLAQASTAMLAQANAAPQLALQLLQ